MSKKVKVIYDIAKHFCDMRAEIYISKPIRFRLLEAKHSMIATTADISFSESPSTDTEEVLFTPNK